MKFKATIEVIYECEPKWYPENATPEEMAKIDEDNFLNNPSDVIGLLDDSSKIKIKVGVV